MSTPLSAKQFGDRSKPIKSMPVRRIRVDKLVPTQLNYIPSKVASMRKHGYDANTVPIVHKHDGDFYVGDGHHRAISHIADGDKYLLARVVK